MNRPPSYLLILLTTLLLFIVSCVSVEKIRTGEQAIERKQYKIAQSLLIKEIENSRGSAKSYKAYQLGIAYQHTNEFDQALSWFLKSEKFGLTSPQLIWNIAKMSKNTGNYTQAIHYFDQISDSNDRDIATQASRERDICTQIMLWESREPDYKVREIEIPGSASVYFSHINPDHSLVVTSDHKTKNNEKSFKWTGRYYTDIYQLDPTNPKEFEPLPDWKSTKDHQGSPSFNSAKTEIIFTVCSNENPQENHCKLFSSSLISGEWQTAVPLGFVKRGINYSHPFISKDSLLFFTCNDPAGIGGYDLYFSRRVENGRWGIPILLPANINSVGNEKFPTVKGDTLYFSSDYFPGYGGLDIFKVYIMPNGQWSGPQNLEAPINSPYDDFGIQYTDSKVNGVLAYFNTNRGTPEGLDKIYSVSKIESSSTDDLISAADEKVKKTFKLFLSLKVVEKVYEDPDDPNSRVVGKRSIPAAQGYFQNGKSFTTRKDGRFISEIAFDSTYSITLSKDGFLQSTVKIPSTLIPQDPAAKERQTVSIELEMIRPYFDKEIVLQNIYYDLDKWDIRTDARPTLDQLAELLFVNPTLKVTIGSHTDCRADEAYNYTLSEKRAQAVVNYLNEKGIDSDRLSFKGYGKSKLVENCICEECTEKQHQKNRRTTFILSQ